MFFYIVPLLIIILSLAGVGLIVIRKFPQLSALEVEKITEIKQAKIKEDLKMQRFQRSLANVGKKTKEVLGFLSVFNSSWLKIQESFRKKVGQTQQKYKKIITEEAKKAPVVESSVEEVETVQTILQKAEEALGRGDLSFAERKYIEVLKTDARNAEAYRGLGKVYLDMEKYREAEETFKFLLKLAPQDDRAFNRLGMIAEKQGDWEKAAQYFEKSIALNPDLAIRYFDLGRLYIRLNKPALALRNYAKAVDIEPGNPKYLDQLVEISIICRDPDMAKEALARLKEVNPENQKLNEFLERIEDIS